MPLPTGWPPAAASGRRSIRFYKSGTGTAAFTGNAFLFKDTVSANPSTLPTPINPGSSDTYVYPASVSNNGDIWAGTIRVFNDGGSDLQVSFDGTNIHGIVKSGTNSLYRDRYEAGISVLGTGVAFRIEAW